MAASRIITPQVKKNMQKVLKDIQAGKFTKNWVKKYKAGLPNYNAMLKEGEKHQIEKTGKRLRNLMPWVPKKSIKGVQAVYN